ncbi:MAG: hypothetical protein KHY93_10005 [Clostridiales bacterium]|nr:hypothetical protein [Clostridiales bacterium]
MSDRGRGGKAGSVSIAYKKEAGIGEKWIKQYFSLQKRKGNERKKDNAVFYPKKKKRK